MKWNLGLTGSVDYIFYMDF